VAATRIISIIGLRTRARRRFWSRWPQSCAPRKFRVMTIKHGSHPADMDQQGKDTWRHWMKARTERVLMEAPGQRVVFGAHAEESDPVTWRRRYLTAADVVLVEGSSARALPKIEVYRRVAGQADLRPRRSRSPATGSPW